MLCTLRPRSLPAYRSLFAAPSLENQVVFIVLEFFWYKEVVINNHSEDDVKLFHAGTKIQDNQLVTSGGRVFCATGTGADLATAQKNAYNLVSKISFEGAVNRKDIGNKGIS